MRARQMDRGCSDSFADGGRGGVRCKLLSDEGSSLVEMAISCAVLFVMLFGIIEMSLALYTYHFVSDAAREASRWAMVRGGNCITNTSQGYCSPTSTDTYGADNGDIQAYVNSLGYPFARNLTTSTKWLTASGGTLASWSTCGTTPKSCNSAGNQVQVTVSYSFPIGIVFWSNTTIPVSSTSSMVIAQ